MQSMKHWPDHPGGLGCGERGSHDTFLCIENGGVFGVSSALDRALEGARGGQSSAPRLLLAGRTEYALPLNESLRRKFDALERVFELKVIGSAARGAPTR